MGALLTLPIQRPLLTAVVLAVALLHNRIAASRGLPLSTFLSLAVQAWTASGFAFAILGAWLGGRLLNILLWPLFGKEERHTKSAQICRVFYKLFFTTNPALALKTAPGSLSWDEVFGDGPAPMVLMNHSSMIDGFALTATLPHRHVGRVRTLAKAGLFKLPVFGGMMTDCGHFPVHFNSSKLGSFQVDKEAQAKTTVLLEAHLERGGCISLFPEGQVNRKDPRTLQTFRRGSMAMARKHKLDIYGFLMVGVADLWPVKEAIPGRPAEVYTKVVKLHDSDPEQDIAAFTVSVEEQMQKALDQLYADVRG